MSIEIKQMVIKSNITQAQSQGKSSAQPRVDSGHQQKLIINEFNRSLNKLVSQKRER